MEAREIGQERARRRKEETNVSLQQVREKRGCLGGWYYSTETKKGPVRELEGQTLRGRQITTLEQIRGENGVKGGWNAKGGRVRGNAEKKTPTGMLNDKKEENRPNERKSELTCSNRRKRKVRSMRQRHVLGLASTGKNCDLRNWGRVGRPHVGRN